MPKRNSKADLSLARILRTNMENMENFGECRNLGQKAAAIRARMGHDPASNFDLPFQPRPNHARPSGRENLPGRKLSSVLTALLLAASGAMQMAHAGHTHAQGSGTVNSVDASGHKVNLTHSPIAALGWPGMTMDFEVAPAVDLRTLQPGARVDLCVMVTSDCRCQCSVSSHLILPGN